MMEDDTNVQAYESRLRQINAREGRMHEKSDEELRAITNKLKAHLPSTTDELSHPPKVGGPIPFRLSRKQNASDDR